MPLAALPFFLQSKYAYEVRRDSFVCNALSALLRRKPNAHYPEFPGWSDVFGAKKNPAKPKGRPRSFDEIMDGILAKL